jgi:hypothetical protein
MSHKDEEDDDKQEAGIALRDRYNRVGIERKCRTQKVTKFYGGYSSK